jgi:acetyl esterase/lipase
MLLYPVSDHASAERASYTENASGYGLDASLMRWFWTQYAPGTPPSDPNISALRLQTVPALPPTLVATAEYDPLRDEGIAYAKKLTSAGIAVTHLHARDMHHNFPVPNQNLTLTSSTVSLSTVCKVSFSGHTLCVLQKASRPPSCRAPRPRPQNDERHKRPRASRHKGFSPLFWYVNWRKASTKL